MTTRSSRSSLLGPPTTVAEDDSLVEELPYHGNDSQYNWTADKRLDHEFFSNDIPTSLEEQAPLSPHIERVIQDFNDELDSVVKSFDGLLSYRKAGGERSIAESTIPYPSYPSTAKKSERRREHDPPPSVDRPSPLRNYVNDSTPVKRFGSASYTPSEPPPAPVQTPGFGFPTPNRRRTVRRTPLQDESFAAGSRYSRGVASTTTRSRLEPQDIQFVGHAEGGEGPGPEPGPEPGPGPVEEDPVVQKLHAIVRDQEKFIQELEMENDDLRKKLELQSTPTERVLPSGEYSRRGDFGAHQSRYEPVPQRARRQSRSDRAVVREQEPVGRRQQPTPKPNTARSPYRSAYPKSVESTPSRKESRLVGPPPPPPPPPPRHIQSLTEAIEELGDAFTPGTRFVAQLATLMRLEQGHHAPLSVILDKHWGQLKHHFMEEDKSY